MAMQTHQQGLKVDINRADYVALAGPHGQTCISIYTAPILAASVEKRDLKRLTTLLRTAQASFPNSRLTVEGAGEMLRSHWRDLQEVERTHPRTQSLAIFMSEDFFGCYHLLSPTQEHVVVGREFDLRPLLPVIPTNDLYFVLSLSQKHGI